MPAYKIRTAIVDDLPAILNIFNEVIVHSTAVYALEPTTLQERRAWFEGRVRAGYPVICAEDATGLIGFASFGDFRGTFPGYRFVVEHSVHVREDRRGQGVGPALVRSLFPLALAMNKHVMIGGIDAANEGSKKMHASLGFEQVAHFREVGHKFGRWLDLIFVQRFLDSPGASRESSEENPQ